MTINLKNNCMPVGFFQKTHGVSGTLVLILNEEIADIIEETAIFFVEEDGILIPWFATENGVRITSEKSALIDLDWIKREPEAKRLAGKTVWIEKSKRLKKIFTNQTEDWIGFEIFDDAAGFLGVISQVNDYGGNVVITIEKNDTEMLIPFHTDLIVDIDEKLNRITLSLPKGLINL